MKNRSVATNFGQAILPYCCCTATAAIFAKILVSYVGTPEQVSHRLKYDNTPITAIIK